MNQRQHFRNFKIITFVLALIFLILFIYAIVNYKILRQSISEEVSEYVDEYGYYAIFILVVLFEISPQPLVSGIIPLATGLTLGMSDYYLLITSAIGVVVSSLLGYFIGKRWGIDVSIKLIGKKDYQRYLELAKKYGNIAIAIAALTPVPYLPVLAGAFKMKLNDFITYGIFFRIIYFLIFGYFLSYLL